MRFVSEKKIKLEKPVNKLDQFVLHFIRIVEKYVDYVIISGYVAILLGRSRATEDVDLFIKPLEKEKFVKLYQELKANDFWCLNAESDDEVYSYLKDNIAIRFATKGQTIPNLEVKFPKTRLDRDAFADIIEVETEEGVINISSLEKQVAFKKYYLCSDKDLEDAKHLEELFKEHLDQEKIKKYKELIQFEYG